MGYSSLSVEELEKKGEARDVSRIERIKQND